MKRTLLTIGIVCVAVLALGFAGFTYAQAQNRSAAPGGGYGMMGVGEFGYGMMGNGFYGHGYGMMGHDIYGHRHGTPGAGGFGHGMMDGFGEMGVLHEYMAPAMAAALGLTPEEFETRHEAGETFWEIAEAQGLTEEEIWGLMVAARGEALALAVADGVISQEAADEMLAHMDAMHTEGFGPGGGHCNGDGRWGNRGDGF